MKKELKKSKVAIVGFAPSWSKAPWKDDEFEIWTLNEAYRLFEKLPDTRADRWFEIHNPDSPSKATPEHTEWLKSCPIPVYMQKHYDTIPKSVPFPFNDIMEWLKEKGHLGFKYFTNSISWMIALAICEGFKEIHVYGVDMAQDESKNGTSEYAYQKPSCEYLLGVAEKYAKVYLPDNSDLLKCDNLYGIDSDNEANVWLKKQICELENRYKLVDVEKKKAQQTASQHEISMAELRGAVTAYRQTLKRRL